MGDALVVFKIFPEDMELIDSIQEALKNINIEKISFRGIEKEPIGFGIEVLKVGYIVPDKTDNLMPRLEEEISKINGVSQVEMAGVTLI
jgi:translation elongation factor aEF-1 beta